MIENKNYKQIDVTVDSMKILSCIKRVHKVPNINTICSVLKGDKSNLIINLGFDKLSTFGIMKEYSKRYILNLINNLNKSGYIHYAGGNSFISLKKEAYDVLFNGKKVYYHEYFQNCWYHYDKVLFSLLKLAIANFSLKYGEDKEIPDYIIREICIQYPVNKGSLMKIRGINKEIISQYGNIILDNVWVYLRDNDIDIHKYHDINLRYNHSDKSTSFIISCNLYNDGMSIDEIVQIRNFSKNTILSHLLMGYQSGIVSNIDCLIHIQYKDEIVKAINEHISNGLKAVKEVLPEEVTYFDIRYFLYELGIKR